MTRKRDKFIRRKNSEEWQRMPEAPAEIGKREFRAGLSLTAKHKQPRKLRKGTLRMCNWQRARSRKRV